MTDTDLIAAYVADLSAMGVKTPVDVFEDPEAMQIAKLSDLHSQFFG